MGWEGARLAVGVLRASRLMNFFDRQIIGAVGGQIRKKWSLSGTALSRCWQCRRLTVARPQ